jgi:allantoinase
VHPAVIGQAQRAKYFDQALTYMKSFPDVWFATGREIADHYITHYYDDVVRRISASEQGR